MSPEPTRLTQRVLVVATGRAAATGSILAVNAILARAWPGEQFGLFAAVWVLGNTLVPVFLLGLPTALLYFYPRRAASERGRLVRWAAGSLGLSGLVLAAVLWLTGPVLARLFGLSPSAAGSGLTASMLPFLPYVVATVAGGYVDAALVASGRATHQAALAVLTAGATIGAATWGLLAHWSVPQVFAALSVVGLGRLALGSGLAAAAVPARSGAPGEPAPGDRLGQFLSYAWTVALNDAAGSLSRSVDRLVVLGLFSTATFGFYHVGAIEVPVGLLLSAAVTVLIPEISRLHREGRLEEIAALWRGVVRRLSLVIMPLFAFLLFFAGPIMALYVPEQFAASRWVFTIYIVALPLRCAMYSPLLIGMGRARWALWGSLGDLGANLLLSLVLARGLLVLLPGWAFLGPAAATVVATYGQVAVLLVLIGRDLSGDLSRLLPWGYLLRLMAVCSAAAALSRGISLLLDTAALQVVLGVAAYAALAAGYLRWSSESRLEAAQVLGAAFAGWPAARAAAPDEAGRSC